jgi:hypothetical protein
LETPIAWTVGGTNADEYDAAFEARSAGGQSVHGEVDFVERHGLAPSWMPAAVRAAWHGSLPAAE